MSVGYDHIDISACQRAGVMVGNTPGVLDATTAETAMAILLSTARKIPQCVVDVKEGRWGTWSPLGFCGSVSVTWYKQIHS